MYPRQMIKQCDDRFMSMMDDINPNDNNKMMPT